jgi:hypothetical protein
VVYFDFLDLCTQVSSIYYDILFWKKRKIMYEAEGLGLAALIIFGGFLETK